MVVSAVANRGDTRALRGRRLITKPIDTDALADLLASHGFAAGPFAAPAARLAG